MSDYLVELGANPTARKAIKTLGLPVPLPQRLRRGKGPWADRPLADRIAAVGFSEGAALAEPIARTLAAAGAEPHVQAPDTLLAPFRDHGEAFGRPPDVTSNGDTRADLLVFDATGAAHPSDLKPVWAFFHSRIRRLRPNGRAVVLARPPAGAASPAAAAASQALEGFARTLAKEVGRKGATAQVVFVETGAEDRVEPLLRWLLSSRSAYVDGRPFHVGAAVPPPASTPLTLPLEGRVTLVTGSAQGIGAATARALHREGARIIVLDHPSQEARAAKIADELGAALLLADITEASTPAALGELLDDRFDGVVDVVVHNAGITRDKMLANLDEDRWDAVIGVNLLAIMALNEELIPRFRDDGRMVALASIAGIAGNAGQTNYAASKAGVIGYVAALAPTVAERGLAVNVVAPGFIETRMTARIPFANREVGRRLCSLGQGGLPGDVAEAITYLCTPGASGLPGQVMRVCGGMLLGA